MRDKLLRFAIGTGVTWALKRWKFWTAASILITLMFGPSLVLVYACGGGFSDYVCVLIGLMVVWNFSIKWVSKF